jgi:hypothetical protein
MAILMLETILCVSTVYNLLLITAREETVVHGSML